MEDQRQNSLVDALSSEIINTTLDPAIDCAEILFDDLVTGVMQEVPFVKTLVAIGKIGFSIRELHTVKKLLVFIKEFNLNNIEPENLDKFKRTFETDSKYRNRITEHLIVMNDRFITITKSEILANLFASYVDNKINWERFQDLSYCLDNTHPKGLKILSELADKGFMKSSEEMVQDKGESQLVIASGIGYESGYVSGELIINDIGKDLFNFGLNRF